MERSLSPPVVPGVDKQMGARTTVTADPYLSSRLQAAVLSEMRIGRRLIDPPAGSRARAEARTPTAEIRGRGPARTCTPAPPLLTRAELEIARSSALLADHPARVEARLLEGARLHVVRAGQVIFQQDTPPEAVFVVLDGWIKLYRLTSCGAEAVVATLGQGQSFGEAAALCDKPWPVSAESVGRARLLRLDASHLRRLMQADAALAAAMLAPALAHLEQLVAHVEELKAHTGVQRVAGFLLNLAAGCEGGCAVALPYGKALLAAQLGMKPETLSRALARLRCHGVRSDATLVHIDDPDRLRALMTERAD